MDLYLSQGHLYHIKQTSQPEFELGKPITTSNNSYCTKALQHYPESLIIICLILTTPNNLSRERQTFCPLQFLYFHKVLTVFFLSQPLYKVVYQRTQDTISLSFSVKIRHVICIDFSKIDTIFCKYRSQ